MTETAEKVIGRVYSTNQSDTITENNDTIETQFTPQQIEEHLKRIDGVYGDYKEVPKPLLETSSQIIRQLQEEAQNAQFAADVMETGLEQNKR